MKIFLHQFGGYVAAIVTGAIITLFLLPPFAQNILANHVPAMGQTFSEMYFFRAVLVLEAASITALAGFFTGNDRTLRIALFTLPIWAPLTYGLLYLALSYR